jgi:cyclophilin family peptidyl-prolyl cis-trans isomerase
MSKQSKRRREEKRRRRSRSPVAEARKARPSKKLPWWKQRWLWAGGIIALVLVAAGAIWLVTGQGRDESAAMAQDLGTPQDPAARNGMYSEPPAMQIDPSKTYVATIETEKGNIVAELYADKAPMTVNNFVFLARQGFYDDTTFHRVLADFMAQAGDPTGTGAGGPGYQFADEFSPDLKHDGPGVLSMANSGPNTNESQFFITYQATPWLDAYDAAGNLKDCQQPDVSCHAVFGRVTEGMDVLESLTLRDPSQNPTFPGDRIITIRIEER